MADNNLLDTHFAALVLAAGRSRRFGSDKRRAELPGDLTLLEQSLRVFCADDIPIFLCLSADARDDDLENRFTSICRRVVRCDHADSGMGSTLAQGIKKIPGHISVLIALGDMPFLRAETIRRICAENRSDRIVFPTYRGRRGHPVLFGCEHRSELEALQGDVGAASVLVKNPDACIAIPVEDPGVLSDIDTPESLTRAFTRNGED